MIGSPCGIHEIPPYVYQPSGFRIPKNHLHGLERQRPGESKAANIGISLPGNGEDPVCPVFVDGEKFASYSGSKDELANQFRLLLEDYVGRSYRRK